MLTGKKRYPNIAAAVEWPSINIKAICARKSMKLKQAADGDALRFGPEVKKGPGMRTAGALSLREAGVNQVQTPSIKEQQQF